MRGIINRIFLIICLCGLLVVTACGRIASDGGASMIQPSEASIQPQQATSAVDSLESDPYPGPGLDDAVGLTPTLNLDAYPDTNMESIEIAIPSGTSEAYPAPDLESRSTNSTAGGAYPEPGESLPTSTLASTWLSTGSNTAPPSITPINSTSTTAERPFLTLTPSVQNPTQLISSSQSISATQTATPSLVRTQLEASDPSSFQLASGEVQFVEFFAYWSPISQSMAPVVYRLEDRYKGSIRFVYLDTDDPANDLFRRLIGDRLPPIFYLLDGEGNVVGEWGGYVMEEIFSQAFEAVVQ
jgi:thiol-disulfide isomerase/thioredoxin